MTEFSECLEEMRAHFKSNIANGTRSQYLPSPRFAALISKKDPRSLDDEDERVVVGLKDLSQSLSQEEASNIQSHLNEDTQKLKDKGVDEKAQNDFKAQIEKRRQKAKETAAANIDKIYDEALRIEEENPGSGPVILATMDVISNLVNAVYNQIATYIGKIIDAVVEWAKTAWKSIRDTFNGISSTISGWFSAAAVPA